MMLQNGLYAITAEELHPGRPLLEVMEETLQGGAKMIQYRDKKVLRNKSLKMQERFLH